MSIMYRDILDFFDKKVPHIKFDKALLKKIRAFRFSWGNKSEEYIEFLSSGYIGVHNIRFSLKDEGFLFKEVLNVDQNDLQYEVYKVPGINRDFKISSNILNLTLVYFMHKFWHSSLSSKEKEEAMYELYSIFAYKTLGSIFSHYFQYSVDKNIAQMVFDRLSNQFLLKKLGNWEEVIVHQCKLLLPPNGNNTERISRLSSDDAVQTINDLRNRMTSLTQNLTKVLMEIHESEEAKLTTTTLVGTNVESGEQEYQDTRDESGIYVNNIKDSFANVNDFIRPDLMYLARKMVSNVKEDKFEQALAYLVAIEPTRVGQFDYISAVIRQSISYLRTKNIINNYNNKAGECLIKLRGYFSASKVKDADVLESKKVLEELVGQGLNSKTKWVITPIVIATCLYLFLRAIDKNK